MAVDLNKPLFQATLGDLHDTLTLIISDYLAEHPLVTGNPVSKKYVYGIAGIANLLGCSLPTAQRIKSSGVLNPAISQIGHLLVVDADHALDLLRVDAKWRATPTVARAKKAKK